MGMLLAMTQKKQKEEMAKEARKPEAEAEKETVTQEEPVAKKPGRRKNTK